MQQIGISGTLADSYIDLGSAEDDSEGDQIPLSKRRRLVKTADKKDGSVSFNLPSTSPISHSRAVSSLEEKGEMVIDLKRKVLKAKVPFIITLKYS